MAGESAKKIAMQAITAFRGKMKTKVPSTKSKTSFMRASHLCKKDEPLR
ncbi:hypothetical protein HMPREF1325_0522 [Treponema socranskii subsp. socranskii VPI DR56BR1116 = ATCC 35536]|uniref:Uncharacterized protein n=1 Tax=Treponema socranskii subsp. socranskii VPI DR56BR1116 = ATCC 35536 TaxID=1125725 RepID=U1GT84_TRESO|nr:hypothetical protein HMPREF1325_0522 [Treponema socranskii subsp. socranskii VPI DR56BR1116 = ATCC 35536]